jgi:peptidoglycan hydrolase-like protein with peptidoglycan-binding domain
MKAGPILRLNDGFDHTSTDLRDEVKRLQNELNQEGFSLNPDGQFGPETEAAVKRYQRGHSLNDDGVVGPLTWAALLGDPSPQIDKIFATTYAPNNPSLLQQLEETPKYRGFIDKAAVKFGFQPSLIAGIGSRESHWGLFLTPSGQTGTGDRVGRRFPTQFRSGPLPSDGGGFGRGLMQIDFDAHEFARTGNWRDPEANILYGASVLADCRSFIQRKTDLADSDQLRAALAAYNCGPGNALNAIRDGRDIDFFTAGRDYSKDVVNRAGWFQLHEWE